jgi:YD repeat-containing protein
MSKSRASRIFFAAFVAAIAAFAMALGASTGAGAQVTIRNYRYKLSMRSQEAAFAAEIASTVGARGTRYEVETDALGRTTRIAVMRGGQKLSETIFRFAADAKLPSEYDSFEAGAKTGVTRIKRDEAGNRIRDDHFTLDGIATEHEEYSYSPDHVQEDFYTKDGKRSEQSIRYYSAKGALTRSITYSNPDNPGKRTEYEYDEGTGLAKSRQQFTDGKLNVTVTSTYNADGDLVRSDAYDSKHQWFAADEFNDELRTKRFYKEPGGTREMRMTYDENRRLKETTLYYKDVFICLLTYDRFPNGAVQRTLAIGPDGERWAEYPDYEVFDVKRNGEPWEGKLPGAVVHKTGPWW